MKRSSAIAGSGVALVVVLVLGLVLLKEDPRKNGTAPGKGATITPRWNLPPLKTEKPAVPTPRGKIELPALPAARDAISGFVKDVKGSPIAAATVALLGDEKCSARTAADGAFNLVPTLAGKKLILYASGPAPFAPRVIPGVAPGTAGLVIVLGAGEATVQGRVVRANDQKPVANASAPPRCAESSSTSSPPTARRRWATGSAARRPTPRAGSRSPERRRGPSASSSAPRT